LWIPLSALAELESAVASGAPGHELEELQSAALSRRKVADDLLQRYITHIGKSG
jgi:hypothetical protein